MIFVRNIFWEQLKTNVIYLLLKDLPIYHILLFLLLHIIGITDKCRSYQLLGIMATMFKNRVDFFPPIAACPGELESFR